MRAVGSKLQEIFVDGGVGGEFGMKGGGEDVIFLDEGGLPSSLARTVMPGATFSMMGPRMKTISSGSFFRVVGPKKTSLASWRP